jgi:ribosomal protein S18 acetylase RimI-like enzyme
MLVGELTMIIRHANSSDFERLVSIKKLGKKHRAWIETVQTQRFAEVSEGKAIYLVVVASNEIIGHVFLKLYGSNTEPDYPNIEDLYIAEDARGRGLGSQLLQEAEVLLKGLGYQGVSLSVNPELNPRAKALYDRLGYKDVGRQPYLGGVYDGDEDWVIDMVKSL